MPGKKMWKQLGQGIRSAFEYAWAYMGTLAAMGLVVGVLGMGIFHAWTSDGEGPEYRCFRGLINCAGAQAPDGVGELPAMTPEAHIRFEYREDGQLSRLNYLDGEGRCTTMPGSKVAEQRLEYDAQGRLTARRNFSATGSPAEDAAGISARLFSYDKDGRLERTTLLDTAGNKVVPRMPGYAEELITYDAKGRPLRIEYRDGLGNPITNARGENTVVFTYNDSKHEVVRTNTIGGKAAENNAGYAIEHRRKTSDGNTEYISWRDSNGEAVENPEVGGAALLLEHGVADHIERHRVCGENGVMTDSARVCAEHLIRTSPDGSLEWECYNAADGLPCDNAKLGYAERVCEYGKDGTLQREYFWNGAGAPCPCYEKRYVEADGTRHVLSLHTDGSTALVPVE